MVSLSLKNDDIIVFAGDSITDSNRLTVNFPLGNGYVYIFNNLLLSLYPELRVTIINSGVSGNTIFDLRDRWEDDVLSYNPTWISVLIGINDILSYLRGQTNFDPESYYKTYKYIMELTRRKTNANLILMSPFYITRTTIEDSFRKKVLNILPKYIEKVEILCKEFNARYINLHSVFQEKIKYKEPTVYAPEAVHPTFAGHLVIAMELIKIFQS